MGITTFLRSYFHSGWAFLIPYLAVYLLYAGLEWPVNSAGENGAGSWVPPLLHVYWFLHAAHLNLAAIVFASWWQKHLPSAPRNSAKGEAGGSVFWSLAPWLCLGLFFWIPGVYLEWPSDPWEHLRRINEWHALGTVTAHSTWTKSSYLIPYSLTGHWTGLTQLAWLNAYYTAVCLLLSWQYYRLGRAADLGQRAAFLFVVLNAVTFGNNIFSFSRYYGLSSTILAQLGAVALTRLALEVAKSLPSMRAFFGGPSGKALASPAGASYAYGVFVAGALLCALIGFSHVQGIGIAGMGVAAVATWRLIEWRRSMVLWLAGAAITASIILVLCYSHYSSLAEFPQPQGWLESWGGFAIFNPHSPSAERALQIFGSIGLLNLAVGVLLTCRNHPAGWLTVMPPLLLSLPAVGLPFTSALVKDDTILTFHRMLFAVPSGLAIACVVARWSPPVERLWTGALTAGLLALVLLPAGHPVNNRFWNTISIVPADLDCSELVEACTSTPDPDPKVHLLTNGSTGFVLLSAIRATPDNYYRSNIPAPIRSTLQLLGARAAAHPVTYNGPPVLNNDPLAKDPAAWMTTAGSPPVFIRDLKYFPFGSTALQNLTQASTEVFTAETIPLDPDISYQVELSARLSGGESGTAFLSIIWYDQKGRFLDSSAPLPQGAGYPTGWSNGTYSYFGLISAIPSHQWRTYRVSFGGREARELPANARFMRVGALLNYNMSPTATIQVSNVRVWEKDDTKPISDGVFATDDRFLLVVIAATYAYTPVSQAAYLSRHWLAQHLATEYAGTNEIISRYGSLDDDRIKVVYLPTSGRSAYPPATR